MNERILYPLYAQQESAKVMLNGYRYFHFYGYIKPGVHDTVVKTIKDGEGYDSIEQALHSEIKISRVFSRDTSMNDDLILRMKRWINMDFGKGFGEDYPEHKCVAWVGPHETQKPLLFYTHESKRKWVTHPQIQLIVQYYGE